MRAERPRRPRDPRRRRRRPTSTTAASGSGRFRRERRAEHPEVGRRLVREQLGVEAVVGGAVQDEHLPPAVGLRRAHEGGIDLEQACEPVLADDARRSARRRRPRPGRSRTGRPGRARGRGRRSRSARRACRTPPASRRSTRPAATWTSAGKVTRRRDEHDREAAGPSGRPCTRAGSARPSPSASTPRRAGCRRS